MDIKKVTRLVNKAKKGNAASIAELYTLTSQAVYFTALKIVGNPTDAEDIVHDTYVAALSKLSELKDSAAFPKWLKTIAANTAKNYILMKKPMLFNSDEEEERLLNGIPEISEDYLPDIAADKKETCRLVSDMVDRLTEKQRMAVVMYYYDEMTVSEIAEVMQTNENTVKSRLNYARKQIKDEVEVLEKKGTRLYSIGAVPVLAMALKEAAEEIAVPETVSAGVNAVVSTVATTAGVGVKIAVISSAAAVSVLGSLTLVIGGSPDKIPFNQENTVTEENVQTTDVRYNDYITSDMGLEFSENDDVITEEITTENPDDEQLISDKVTYPTENYASIRENQVDIYPAEAWYDGEKFVVKCIVTNGFNVDKIVTSVPKFIITDVNGNEITNARFDSVGVTVPAKNYIVHTFTFSGAALINANADYSNISWSITTNFSDVSASVTSLGTASQTVMGGKVKVTAEKLSSNTIVLTIENNFENEVSTFSYPQIRVNGMIQNLDSQLQFQNGATNIFAVPVGEKGQITYYVSDINSVEALIGELFSTEYFEDDENFSLEF